MTTLLRKPITKRTALKFARNVQIETSTLAWVRAKLDVAYFGRDDRKKTHDAYLDLVSFLDAVNRAQL